MNASRQRRILWYVSDVAEKKPLHKRRWFQWTIIAAAALVIAAVAFDELYVVDLRPSTLRIDELPPDVKEQGQIILEEAANAHGLKAWQSHQVLDLTFVDEWYGGLAQRLYMEWGHSPQRIRAQFLRGTWTSRYEFLDGPEEGHVWGLQSWRTYKIKPDGEPAFESDAALEFLLPTVQYFFELPFRIRDGSVIAYAGTQEWRGRSYETVFVTWNSLAPNRNMDQYVIWIDQETKLVGRADYTVRDQGAFVSGSAEYGDFRDVGGVQLAFKVGLLATGPGGIRTLVHEMRIDEAAWDEAKLALLLPNPDLPPEGDSKPSPTALAE